MVRTVPAESEKAAETGVIFTEEQCWAIEDIQDSLDDNDDNSHEGLVVLTSELINLC